MRRLHLVEIHEQEWCPRSIRDAATDYLQFIAAVAQPYRAIADRLSEAIGRARATRVVDLCSGAGGPWLELHEVLDADEAEPIVILTDLFPNSDAIERVSARSEGRLAYHPSPVDATRAPPEIEGFRTMFASFHHFRPTAAAEILRDAVRRGEGIAVFEMTHRSPVAILAMGITPLLVLLTTPFVRPFRWSRLFWTYVVPTVPLVLLFDGIVSCLRTYSPAELLALADRVDERGYVWEAGEQKARTGPVPVTYLIGCPQLAEHSEQ